MQNLFSFLRVHKYSLGALTLGLVVGCIWLSAPQGQVSVKRMEKLTPVLVLPPPPPPPKPPEPKVVKVEPLDQPAINESVVKAPDKPAPAPIRLGPGSDNLGLRSGNGTALGTGDGGGGGSRWGWYDVGVKNAIIAALEANPKTKNGSYNLQIAVYPDMTSGRITQIKLTTSTGDAALDETIRQLLVGLELPDVPPSGRPLPLAMQLKCQP